MTLGRLVPIRLPGVRVPEEEAARPGFAGQPPFSPSVPTQQQQRELQQLEGRDQFEKAVEFGLIEPGSTYVEPITQEGIELVETLETGGVLQPGRPGIRIGGIGQDPDTQPTPSGIIRFETPGQKEREQYLVTAVGRAARGRVGAVKERREVEAVLEALEEFYEPPTETTKGGYNLVEAIEAGKINEVRAAGFDSQEVVSAQSAVAERGAVRSAYETLEDLAPDSITEDGGIYVGQALEAGVSESALRTIGISQDSIDEAKRDIQEKRRKEDILRRLEPYKEEDPGVWWVGGKLTPTEPQRSPLSIYGQIGEFFSFRDPSSYLTTRMTGISPGITPSKDLSFTTYTYDLERALREGRKQEWIIPPGETFPTMQVTGYKKDSVTPEELIEVGFPEERVRAAETGARLGPLTHAPFVSPIIQLSTVGWEKMSPAERIGIGFSLGFDIAFTAGLFLGPIIGVGSRITRFARASLSSMRKAPILTDMSGVPLPSPFQIRRVGGRLVSGLETSLRTSLRTSLETPLSFSVTGTLDDIERFLASSRFAAFPTGVGVRPSGLLVPRISLLTPRVLLSTLGVSLGDLRTAQEEREAAGVRVERGVTTEVTPDWFAGNFDLWRLMGLSSEELYDLLRASGGNRALFDRLLEDRLKFQQRMAALESAIQEERAKVKTTAEFGEWSEFLARKAAEEETFPEHLLRPVPSPKKKVAPVPSPEVKLKPIPQVQPTPSPELVTEVEVEKVRVSTPSPRVSRKPRVAPVTRFVPSRLAEEEEVTRLTWAVSPLTLERELEEEKLEEAEEVQEARKLQEAQRVKELQKLREAQKVEELTQLQEKEQTKIAEMLRLREKEELKERIKERIIQVPDITEVPPTEPPTKPPTKPPIKPPIKPPTKPPTKPPEEPKKKKKKKKPKFKRPEEAKKALRIVPLPLGTIYWVQGELNKTQVYKILKPPYDKRRIKTLLGRPQGLPSFSRGVTPQGSIGIIGGPVSKDVDVDLGVVDIFIKAGSRRPSIRFKGGGLKTDVGKRHPSPTIGISVRSKGKVRRRVVQEVRVG